MSATVAAQLFDNFAEAVLTGEHKRFILPTVADSVRRHVVVNATPSAVGITAILSDVTELVQAQRAARDESEKLRIIADTVPALIAYCDTDLRYQFANKTAQEWHGQPHDSLVGKVMPGVINQGEKVSLRPHIAFALAGQTVNFELTRMFADGVKRTLDVNYVPHITSEKEVVGFFILANDVTEQATLRRKLEDLATTDSLTGAANRRAFFEIGDAEIRQAVKCSQPLSVIMLDINKFKFLNDTYGHATGDFALKDLTRLCKMTLRNKADIFARLGGEEFGIVLPGTSAQQAASVAERLRRMIESCSIECDGQHINISCSFGDAEMQVDELGLETLLSRADSALYEAKHTGRNRVCVAGESGELCQADRVA